MLRDFPITGNEGATKADGYPSLDVGMFVNKGHGLKELDKVAPRKDSTWSVLILHIDSSREDVDYIQFDYSTDSSDGETFSDTIALISRGQTSKLGWYHELAFRAMRGEKVARPLPYPNDFQLNADKFDKNPTAFIRTEPLQVVKGNNSFLDKDRYQVYKAHGFLPGDNVKIWNPGGDSLDFTIVDIIPSENYDEIVLNTVATGAESANIQFNYRPDDSSLSPELLAKRNAYISKLQAS